MASASKAPAPSLSVATTGGEKASAAQAWMQARSKVWPDSVTTRSTISVPEIGRRNSAGESAVNDDGRDGNREAEGSAADGGSGGAHHGWAVPVVEL